MSTKRAETELFDVSGQDITGVRPRTRLTFQLPVNPAEPVCVALFVGDSYSHDQWGANRLADAVRAARRMRRQGVAARLYWLNVGAWNRELWTQDLARPLGVKPDHFYGEIPADVRGDVA